jgi:hypothetical protein
MKNRATPNGRGLGLLVLMVSVTFSLAAQQLTEAARSVEPVPRDSVDNIGNQYISFHSRHPSVMTFVNSDGTVAVCTSSDGTAVTHSADGSITITVTYTEGEESGEFTYIYEYDGNLQELRTLRFQNELAELGAFTKDDDGNYYFFYAVRASGQNAENMAMVKYDRDGNKTNAYKLTAQAANSFGGIKIPYDAGTCRLEVSGSMLAVFLSRERFDGHQASYGFVLDKDTFERVDKGYVYFYTNGTYPRGNNLVPFAGHSLNQFILPIDNGFVFADHGDAYPRAFTFGKFQNGRDTVRLNAFKFPGSTGQNATYAEMGGLAKTSTGYIFAGAYGTNRNTARNVFVLTFSEEMRSCSAPIYLTRYTKDNGHAGHPKIVALDAGRYLLAWEVFAFSTQSANSIVRSRTGYLSTYMMLINERGQALSQPWELKGTRLNMNDVLRCNPSNGKVYWAINDSGTSIILYAMEIEE